MQTAKKRCLTKEWHGELNEADSTYGKSSPCPAILCIACECKGVSQVRLPRGGTGSPGQRPRPWLLEDATTMTAGHSWIPAARASGQPDLPR